LTDKLSERIRDACVGYLYGMETFVIAPHKLLKEVEALESENTQLKEQVKHALEDTSVEGEVTSYHPICERCCRVCYETKVSSEVILEYKCHFCVEREKAEAEVKTLREQMDSCNNDNMQFEKRNIVIEACLERVKALQKENDCGLELVDGYPNDPDSCYSCEAYSENNQPCWYLRLKEALK
jgi:hypothetical protein